MARPRTSRTPPKRQQVPLPWLLTATALGVCAVAAIFATTVLGGGSTGPTSGGCAIGDVSGSTAGVRDTYVAAFRTFATDIGTDGSGKVCLIVAAGDPIAEGVPQFANVGPDQEHRGSPDLAPVDVTRKVEAATADVSRELAHPEVGVGGSALVEAASARSEAPQARRPSCCG